MECLLDTLCVGSHRLTPDNIRTHGTRVSTLPATIISSQSLTLIINPPPHTHTHSLLLLPLQWFVQCEFLVNHWLHWSYSIAHITLLLLSMSTDNRISVCQAVHSTQAGMAPGLPGVSTGFWPGTSIPFKMRGSMHCLHCHHGVTPMIWQIGDGWQITLNGLLCSPLLWSICVFVYGTGGPWRVGSITSGP